MQSKKASTWAEGLLINVVSNGICLVVGVVVGYLQHEGSGWVLPILFGTLAWLLTMGIWVVARLYRNIPVRQVRVTDSNLQKILRGWLDDIGLKVQTAKEPTAEFVFIVTTDGGWVISIMRHQESFPEYLTFRAYYSEEAQNQTFAHFTDAEKIEARLILKLELTRAVMGYVTQDILTGFTLFKRIPITHSLSIEDVSKTLWEVEAALASVFVAGAVLLHRKAPPQPVQAN
jgi:hypothetical protein